MHSLLCAWTMAFMGAMTMPPLVVPPSAGAAGGLALGRGPRARQVLQQLEELLVCVEMPTALLRV